MPAAVLNSFASSAASRTGERLIAVHAAITFAELTWGLVAAQGDSVTSP